MTADDTSLSMFVNNEFWNQIVDELAPEAITFTLAMNTIYSTEVGHKKNKTGLLTTVLQATHKYHSLNKYARRRHHLTFKTSSYIKETIDGSDKKGRMREMETTTT